MPTLLDKRLLIFSGKGVAGKSTVAAATAVAAARRGKRVIIVEIGDQERIPSIFGARRAGYEGARVYAGKTPGAGEIWSMCLTAREALHEFAVRSMKFELLYEAVFENRVMRYFTAAAPDLLVLDTPPTRHTLDFLDAPAKMMGFMDEGVLKLFLTPSRMAGRFGFGFLTSSSAWMFKALERHHRLRDAARYRRLHQQLQRHARRRIDLLARDESESAHSRRSDLFPSEARRVSDAVWRLHREPCPRQRIKRVRGERRVAGDADDPARIFHALGVTGPPSLAERIAENFDRFQALAEMDAAGIERLKTACAGAHLWRTVPAFDLDLHDLSDLARVNRYLFADKEE